MSRRHAAVLGLTLARAGLGPVMVVLAGRAPGGFFVGAGVFAFVSDYFDGVLARRWGLATERIRSLDSAADTVFWFCAAWSAWRMHAPLLRPMGWLVAVIVGLEVTRWLFDALKFGRQAAYHAWSAKAWGVSLIVAFVALMGFAQVSPWVPIAAVLGIVADVEGLLMSVILPAWAHDVRSVVHAWRLRQALLSAVAARP